MRAELKPYQSVRVVDLKNEDPANYDGWKMNHRPPRIGDTGTIVEVLHAAGLPDRYVVECVETGGKTVWLADFDEGEIQPV